MCTDAILWVCRTVDDRYDYSIYEYRCLESVEALRLRTVSLRFISIFIIHALFTDSV